MLTLGIDTSTRVCSVAVAKDDKILGAVDINVGLTHSEGLVPQLEQLLTLAQVTKEELELIAVSRGPGSFTGLRIGMATAEALVLQRLNPPLRLLIPLQVIAHNLPVEGVLQPVLDAQKGNAPGVPVAGGVKQEVELADCAGQGSGCVSQMPRTAGHSYGETQRVPLTIAPFLFLASAVPGCPEGPLLQAGLG